MKTIKVLFIWFQLCLIFCPTVYSEEYPKELSMFYSSPEVIKPGVKTTFTYIFKVPMDVSERPTINIKMTENNALSFKAEWIDDFSCELVCSLPMAIENYTAEITLTDIKTADNKVVDNIHAVVNFIRETQKVNDMALLPAYVF